MKIGINATRYSLEEGTGVEHYSFYIINALLEEILKNSDHEVVLYVREPVEFVKQVNEIIKKRPGQIKQVVVTMGSYLRPSNLSQMVKAEAPDAFFSPWHGLPSMYPKQTVVMIHNVSFKFQKASYSWWNYRRLCRVTKLALKNASRVLVPSSQVRTDVLNYFRVDESKIEVVHSGFDAQLFNQAVLTKTIENSPLFEHFKIEEIENFVLFVGRLESRKNLVRMVQAFGEFEKKHPGYHMVLAGMRGFKFKKLLQEIQLQSLGKKIFMPGYITEEEKAVFYSRCKVFAYPSLYQGYGFPVLEAFNYGKPVMCSTYGSLPEIAEAGAHYVDPLDAEHMAQGLSKLVDDEEYAARLVESGKKQLRKFSWEAAAKKTLKAIYGQ